MGMGATAGGADVGAALTAAKLKEQLHHAACSNTELALAAVSQEATMHELHNATQQLAAEKDQLAVKLQSRERELVDAGAELHATETRVSLLEAGAEACRRELEEVRACAQEDAKKAARAQAEAEQRAATAGAAVEAARSRATATSAEAEQRAAELTQRAARSDAQANALADGAEKLLQEKGLLEVALATAQQETASANNAAQTATARAAELESSRERLRRELHDLHENADRARQEVADARAATAAAQAAAASTEARQRLDEEAAVQRVRLEADRLQAQETDRLQAREAERRRATDELAALREQQQREMEPLRKRADAAEAELKRLQVDSKAEVQAATAKLEEARKAGADAQVRAAQALSELNAARAEVSPRLSEGLRTRTHTQQLLTPAPLALPLR